MQDIERRIRRILESRGARFGEPPEVLECEAALASFFEKRHAVLVSSGTAAIHTALVACGVGPGDEVLVPALAPVMTVAPVIYLNATPVFIDCGENSLELDERQLQAALTARTKVLLVVHLWGYPCSMDAITKFASRNNVAVVEDACQAHGSRWGDRLVGTDSACGCFSTRDGKLMSTGEGGFLLTDDDERAAESRRFRTHYVDAKNPNQSFMRIGANYRPTAVQAILTLRELSDLQSRVATRIQYLQAMSKALQALPDTCPLVFPPEAKPNGYSAVYLFQSKLPPRFLAEELAKQGLVNSVGSFGLRPLPYWPAVSKHGRMADASIGVPHCHKLLDRALAILLHDDPSHNQIQKYTEAVRAVLATGAAPETMK